MARQARIKSESGLFHIHQRSGSERKIFESDADRTAFLAILKRATARFGFRLYSYCLLSDTDYHLVMDVMDNDLSKIMKSINISYSMYAKCQGPLFKDRYRSIPLSNTTEVKNHMDSLHEKAQYNKEATALGFNSFCTYDSHTPLKLDFVAIVADGHPSLMDDAHFGSVSVSDSADSTSCPPAFRCIKTYPEAQSRLELLATENQQTVAELLADKTCRNRLIHTFRRETTLSLKELGQLFGGLSESAVSKLLRE